MRAPLSSSSYVAFLLALSGTHAIVSLVEYALHGNFLVLSLHTVVDLHRLHSFVVVSMCLLVHGGTNGVVLAVLFGQDGRYMRCNLCASR